MTDQKRSISLRFTVPPVEWRGPGAFQPQTIEIFCTSFPPVEAVQAELRSLRCFLQRTLRPGGQQATAQYHFEGSYGVAVIFLAGYDSSKDSTGQTPIDHEARFWISGNTHPRSLDLQKQIRMKLMSLTDGVVVEAAPLPLQKGA